MTETPTSWRTMLGDQIDLGREPAEAAEATLAAIAKKDRDAYLLALLAQDAERIRRTRVHTKEKRVQARIAAGADPVKARRELVGAGFHLPDSRYVAHLEASAADHLARAGWLRDHAEATTRSAIFHEECAAAIEAAGVTCLADLDPALRPKAA